MRKNFEGKFTNINFSIMSVGTAQLPIEDKGHTTLTKVPPREGLR